MDEEGNWELDYDKAKEFWYNLSAVLPEEVGSVLTPMDLSKISFEKTHTGDTNEVADAEDSLYSASGISRLLFGGKLTSAHALLLSIKNDQAITYGIVKSIEDAINRYVQSLSYGKNWKVNFLDVSPYNREEMGAQYLKAASYGLPTISAYAASQGLGQAELDGDHRQVQEHDPPAVSAASLHSNKHCIKKAHDQVQHLETEITGSHCDQVLRGI
jgi:hypothetical protein